MDDILEKIYKSSIKLLAPSTLEEVNKTVVEEAMNLVGADSGAIYLMRNDEFKVVYASHEILYDIKPRKKANTYKAFISQKPVLAQMSNLEKAHPQLRTMMLKAAIFIPLSYQNKALGVLTVNTKQENKFDRKTLRVLVLFGSMVSLAIKKAQLYDDVREALEVRDRFISMAAHELRTPLTSINGYIQLLHRKLANNNTSEARWIEQLYFEGVRMQNLINELLELNRIKAGHLTYYLKECNLREMTERVKNNFTFGYPDRELVYEDKIGNNSDVFIGDYDKLLQVITNIIDNAVKFSSPGQRVYFTIDAKGSDLSIKIRDEGIGIPKKDLTQIFQGYYRGANHEAREGMGIGLFIVKDILNRIHGSISVKSSPRKGSTFEIKLPKAII